MTFAKGGVANVPRLWIAIVWEAITKFNRDDGWAIASHVALSSLFALFPFLIFATSIAAFFELGGFADTVVHLIFDYWPKEASEAIAREVKSILTEPRSDFLTLGGILAIYFASNGVEALRVALNRAYRIGDKRPIWLLRLQSIAFVFVAMIALLAITLLLVFLPLGWGIAEKWFPQIIPWQDSVRFWRFVIALGVLSGSLIMAHVYLPAGNRSVISVLPGIVFTIFCWMIGSVAYGMWLEQFADYVSTYAGLAGAMIGLIFLYFLGLVFILGGEINAAWLRRRRLLRQT